jgi:glutamyl-tRNA reductase
MIGMIGTNHKRSTLVLREAICKALVQFDDQYKELLPCLLLQTCNRVEWYFFSQNPTIIHEAVLATLRDEIGQENLCCLYTFFREDCFSHLIQVTSGLDSLFVGETAIQAQVKNSYLSVSKTRTLCKELHSLFQKALHKAKIIRSTIVPKQEKTLTDLVVQCVLSHIRIQKDPKVLFIGTSMINRSIAAAMSPLKIPTAITNRTIEKTTLFASDLGATSLPWELLEDLWCDYSCVIAATRASECLLKDSERILPKKQILIDLSIPRNIDPQLSLKQRVVLNIDSFMPNSLHNCGGGIH